MAIKNELKKDNSSPNLMEKVSLVQTNIEEYLAEQNSQIDQSENSESNEKLDQIVQTEENDNIKNQVEDQDWAIDLQKKKLDDVEQTVSKHKSKKRKTLNIIFFIVNIAVVCGILIYQILTGDWVPITGIDFSFWHLFSCIVILGGVVLVETIIFTYLLRQTTGKVRFSTAYKVAEIGRYYDCVTPMATGGQAFQVSYLKSRGVSVHASLSIPMAKYVFGQISWVLISLVCMIVSWTDPSYGTFVSVASILGFSLSTFILFITVFLSVCKTAGKKLVINILKLLHKIKIVKNYDKQYEKLIKYVSDYQDIMKQYAKSPKDFIILTLLSIARNILNYSMPFFIVHFFVPGLEGEMYWKLCVMTCLVDLSSSFFPLPGGTGMNEISFTAAFGAVVSQTDVLVWVLLVWRFCSYYFYLIQGVCILSYDIAYGNRKYKWVVKRDNLAEESAVFKQEQINKFRSDRAKRRKNKTKLDKKEYL